MAEGVAEFESRLAHVEQELARLKAVFANRQLLAPVETYSDQRIAQFLLSNATDAGSYQRAREEVERMGLDPDEVDHWTPAGGW